MEHALERNALHLWILRLDSLKRPFCVRLEFRA
jgi:hypothetical protein